MATRGALRRIQAGNALASFGSGFTVPFLWVYATDVQGLSDMWAGIALMQLAVSALIVLPFVGPAIDRFGPNVVVVGGSAVAAAGSLVLGFGHGRYAVLAGVYLLGAGVSAIQPALATMIVRVTDSMTRARAFALQFTFNNLGLGIGAGIAGLIVDVDRPGSFTVLFCIEAAMVLVLAVIVGRVEMPALAPMPASNAAAGAKAGSIDGWKHVLKNRAMVKLAIVSAVIFFTVYGQFEVGVAAFATEVSKISPGMLGAALFVNTLVIVVAQLFVLRATRGRQRSAVIALTGVVWLGAWLFAAASGLFNTSTLVAAVTILVTYGLFGLGEALLAPTLGPMVADLAPSHLVGAYNSALSLAKQLSVSLGFLFGTVIAAFGAWTPYIVLMTASSVLISVLGLRLRKHLTPVQNGRIVASSEEIREDAPQKVSVAA